MELNKEQLLELQDYVNALYDEVGLDPDTYDEITKKIDKRLDKIREQENLTDHINGLTPTTP